MKILSGTIFALWLMFLSSSAGAESEELQPPWKANRPIATVKKELYRKHPQPGAAAVVSVAYVGPKLERLEIHNEVLRSDVGSSARWRLSTDNGNTWSDFQPMMPLGNIVVYVGVEVWEGGGPKLFDPQTGVLVEMWLRQIKTNQADRKVKPQFSQCTYSRISRDFGKTWSEPQMLRYEPGEAFDPKKPLAPGFIAANQAYFGSNILKLAKGELLHAVCNANTPDDAKKNARGVFGERMGSLCFLGKWNPDIENYQWTPGKPVAISPDRSSRGLMEPELAELKDGRVLVIWRGNNTNTTPGRKFFSLSADGGRTFGAVEEMQYNDGSGFYSPSSYHRMIRHSVTGKLYWIGNISAAPPQGNLPRYPLVIAEVDEAIPALKKNTVTAIDDKRPDQNDAIQFSNFSLLEDRESRSLELYMTLYGETASKFDADCYKYVVTLGRSAQ
jgi:hypothetical protein